MHDEKDGFVIKIVGDVPDVQDDSKRNPLLIVQMLEGNYVYQIARELAPVEVIAAAETENTAKMIVEVQRAIDPEPIGIRDVVRHPCPLIGHL